MNFFKSVFPTDPDPSDPADENPPPTRPEQDDSSPSGAWSFGGLIKTIASKSESVIQTYRRDLEEFGSGLKKETDIIKEAIKELPGSLEVGASVAQESLETVGHAIDEFGNSVWRGTAEIISHGKDALLADQEDSDSWSDAHSNGNSGSKSAVRYSRFEAQVYAIQIDPNTYCEEPEDSEDYYLWVKGFSLEEVAEEIGSLAGLDGVMEGVYRKLVPSVADHETFWSRYFYKFYKLKQAEDARANLVKRAISGDEEELSWEVDEEDQTEDGKENAVLDNEEMIRSNTELVDGKKITSEESAEKSSNAEVTGIGSSSESINNEGSDEKAAAEGSLAAQPGTSDVFDKSAPVDESSEISGSLNGDGCILKADEKSLDNKMDPGDLSKDSDFSVVSSQPSFHEEDDLGWDEIEDIGSGDEKKIRSSGGSPSKIDPPKRLSVRDEDEDLSWDIEEDDPPK